MHSNDAVGCGYRTGGGGIGAPFPRDNCARMILSPDDARVFFRVWASLDAFVNRRTAVVPDLQTSAEARVTGPVRLGPIRVALWREPALLDAFIAENPDGLSLDDLAIVGAFRHAVPGKFYVERVLKAHAVFVSTKTNQTYLVGGLTDRIDDVLAQNRPVGYAAVADTVLLPFRGGIVWDGIVGIHNVSFGPGMRQNFKDAYLTAKARGELIGTLDGAPRLAVAPKKGPDKRPAVTDVARAIEQLGKPETALQGAAFRLLRPCAQLALLTLDDRLDEHELVAQLRSVRRALKQVEVALVRLENDPGR